MDHGDVSANFGKYDVPAFVQVTMTVRDQDDVPAFAYLSEVDQRRVCEHLPRAAIALPAVYDHSPDAVAKLVRADTLESEARLLRNEAHAEMLEVARADERDACAKILDELLFVSVREQDGDGAAAYRSGAAAIRARGDR